jgi:glycosyltransferase involved in cell wall biosynthesis
MSADISILICTRNRAESLRQTLLSISQTNVPSDLSCELVVIDNGSSDNTRQTVASAHSANMQVRYELEPRVGQCFARNRGLECTSGKFILFTDDDVRVPSNWIEGMCRPLQLGVADAVAGGVKIAPHLLREWMSGRDRTWLGSTYHLSASQPSDFIGANFSFARCVLEKVPKFDTALGPGALGFGDDTILARQLIDAGYRLVGELDVCVEHHFDPARLSRRSLLRMAERSGRTSGFLHHHWDHEQTPLPLLRAIKTGAQLRLLRLVNLHRLPAEGLPQWEANLLWKHYRWRQYLQERRRPPRYPSAPALSPCVP